MEVDKAHAASVEAASCAQQAQRKLGSPLGMGSVRTRGERARDRSAHWPQKDASVGDRLPLEWHLLRQVAQRCRGKERLRLAGVRGSRGAPDQAARR
ncbi:MAG: hypothetical protein CBD47_07440 [Synechococcus sp. TMED187]|nr:MAG: hypothetical protein CBD47_07440 [Synechococcus sp. TMED187]